MSISTGIELLHGACQQCPGNAALLQIRQYAQLAEEADPAPINREVGADQFPVQRRTERGDMTGRMTAESIIPIGPENFRVRRAEKRAEGDADNARGFWQIFFTEWRDPRLACRRSGIDRRRVIRHESSRKDPR